MRVPLFYVELTEKSRTNMKQESQTTASRPFAALLLVTGLVALFVLGYRLLANRSEAAPDALEPRQPPPRPPDRPMDMSRAKRLLRLAIIHPFITSVLVVALAVLLTLAYLQIASSADAEVLARQPPSEYDEHFNYGQMQAMWHFAMCDAMLFSTKPEGNREGQGAHRRRRGIHRPKRHQPPGRLQAAHPQRIRNRRDNPPSQRILRARQL